MRNAQRMIEKFNLDEAVMMATVRDEHEELRNEGTLKGGIVKVGHYARSLRYAIAHYAIYYAHI